ncbi:MAG: orotate phosphoribosyltransferase [Clostridia bacterium]|jgi:orotate phosphoribosyltransferase
MSKLSDELTVWLFETNAIRVCAKDKPFWYTSGTIGPYYINTHFLYGNEEKAVKMLKIIDEEKAKILTCPLILLDVEIKNYMKDKTYKSVIDEMCTFIDKKIGLDNIDYISGGERRDWFFSIITAHLLNKPHITIFKDLKTVLTEDKKAIEITELKDKNILHIVDLVTEASSYERAWIPAIQNLGSSIKWSLSVVDRKQGGEKVFEKANVKAFTMVSIDNSLFDGAFSKGLINYEQNEMVQEFIKNPYESMRKFLISNPEFIEESLGADDKTRARAELCMKNDIYNLKK